MTNNKHFDFENDKNINEILEQFEKEEERKMNEQILKTINSLTETQQQELTTKENELRNIEENVKDLEKKKSEKDKQKNPLFQVKKEQKSEEFSKKIKEMNN